MNIIEKTYQWRAKLAKRTETKCLVLHHAAAKTASPDDIHSWHLQNGWAGIGYHFFIRKDGSVYTGRPADTIGAHCEGHNSYSLGVCLEGDYEQEQPPKTQIDALVELIKYLQTKYTFKVVRHKDLASSSCPGRNVNMTEILNRIEVKGVEHWGEEIFRKLNEKGITFSEKRFDDEPTRAEMMASILKAVEYVDNKLKNGPG